MSGNSAVRPLKVDIVLEAGERRLVSVSRNKSERLVEQENHN